MAYPIPSRMHVCSSACAPDNCETEAKIMAGGPYTYRYASVIWEEMIRQYALEGGVKP